MFKNYPCSCFALGVYGLCPSLLEAFISLGSNWDLLGKNTGRDNEAIRNIWHTKKAYQEIQSYKLGHCLKRGFFQTRSNKDKTLETQITELEDWLWNPPGNRVILQQGGGWGSMPDGHVVDIQDRGWDGWMASSTQWTWVWVNSGSWWWTGRPGVLRFMGLQRVGHDWATELNWTELGWT